MKQQQPEEEKERHQRRIDEFNRAQQTQQQQKYLRKDSDSNDITNVQILDKDNVMNLPKIEYEKLQTNIENNSNSFVE